ncbi:MAG: hypothetical protein E7080_10015 [Bacteroidales bacterium]|nr:hypothetical protein [Bacteroidales bacterium]
MEMNNDFAELQELKEQFNILNEKLEKQIIINETLIKESMKKKLSYVDRTYKMYKTAFVITTPLLIALLLLYKASMVLCIFVGLSLIVEMILYRKEYRKLNTKELMSLNHIEAVERVVTFKKNFKRNTIIMLIPGVILFVAFVGLVTGYKFEIGTVVLYLIFVLLALTYEFVRYKKMFSKLDSVLKQIEELRSE